MVCHPCDIVPGARGWIFDVYDLRYYEVIVIEVRAESLYVHDVDMPDVNRYSVEIGDFQRTKEEALAAVRHRLIAARDGSVEAIELAKKRLQKLDNIIEGKSMSDEETGDVLRTYWVIGIYHDTDQRFCDEVEAVSAEAAEEAAKAAHPTLMVAAVLRVIQHDDREIEFEQLREAACTLEELPDGHDFYVMKLELEQ